MSKRRFPILNPKSSITRSVPWSVLEPHRAQAMTNHGQTLEGLAKRGGLSSEEMLAIVLDMRWHELYHEGQSTSLLRTPSQRHNEITRKIMPLLLEPLREGGTNEEVLIIFMGTYLAMVKLGGDNAVLDVMIDRVRQRLAEQRLGPLPAGGKG